MYETLLRKRLTELRTGKGVSARDMSLSLGQSESYINKIENGKSLPSMEVFFYICDYFNIHPSDFFAEERGSLYDITAWVQLLSELEPETREHIRYLAEKLAK